MYSQDQSRSLHQLVEEYAPLVTRIVHHMMVRLPASVCADDLYQAGIEGLLDAAQRYESDKGASFSTFASIRIRGSILDEMRRGDWCPRSVHKNTRDISRAIRRVEERTGRAAKDKDIASELEVTLEQYRYMLSDMQGSQLFSLENYLEHHDETIDTDSAHLDHDRNTPLDKIERQFLLQRLKELITTLPEKEKLVLSLYYDEELNLKEIGEVLNVSESRISQILSQAAARIRAKMLDS